MNSNNSYELLILLGNDTTTVLPYVKMEEVCLSDKFQPSRIPTTLSFSNSRIALGRQVEDSKEEEQNQIVGGFVNAFLGFYERNAEEEVSKLSTCLVSCNESGQVQYRVPSLNNQVITPGLALQLFIKYLVDYETHRRNIVFKRIIVAYPVWCTMHHGTNLTYLIQGLHDFRIVCVSQIPCFLTSLGNMSFNSTSKGKHAILMYATYELLHIFFCSSVNNQIIVLRHFQSTPLSHQGVASTIFTYISNHFKQTTKCTFSQEQTEAIFEACCIALDKLLIQSRSTINVSYKGRIFSYLLHDNLINHLVSPLYNALRDDLESVARRMKWKLQDICTIIITGESSTIPVYRQWAQKLQVDRFRSAISSCCWDAAEIVNSGFRPFDSIGWSLTGSEEEHMLMKTMMDVTPVASMTSETKEMAKQYGKKKQQEGKEGLKSSSSSSSSSSSAPIPIKVDPGKCSE